MNQKNQKVPSGGRGRKAVPKPMTERHVKKAILQKYAKFPRSKTKLAIEYTYDKETHERAFFIQKVYDVGAVTFVDARPPGQLNPDQINVNGIISIRIKRSRRYLFGFPNNNIEK